MAFTVPARSILRSDEPSRRRSDIVDAAASTELRDVLTRLADPARALADVLHGTAASPLHAVAFRTGRRSLVRSG